MRRAEVGQGRRGTFGHTDLVCVERQRDHRVVADQRGQFDDAGGAVCVEDAAVGRVGRAMVAQQLDSVVVDGLLVWRGEAVAAVTQRLDGLLGEAGLARLALVREPLELAVRVSHPHCCSLFGDINKLRHLWQFLQVGLCSFKPHAIHPSSPRPATTRNRRAIETGRPFAYTASFSSLAGRNATFLLALILIASPVAGFRPILAARFRTWRMPRPVRRILSPFFR